jgi:hypothetical protein
MIPPRPCRSGSWSQSPGPVARWGVVLVTLMVAGCGPRAARGRPTGQAAPRSSAQAAGPAAPAPGASAAGVLEEVVGRAQACSKAARHRVGSKYFMG